MKRAVALIAIAALTLACSHNPRNRTIRADVEKLFGSAVSLPHDIDTVRTLKIVSYIDRTTCMTCFVDKAQKWRELCKEECFDANHVAVCFIVCPEFYAEEQSAQFEFINNAFRMIRDDEDAFKNSHPFVNDAKLCTFLLDENNKIVLVGSPIEHESLYDLYAKTIRHHTN